MTSNQLAIQGGVPAFPDGPPSWPIADERIEKSIRSAIDRGDWGKYDSPLGDALIKRLCEQFQVQHALPCSSGTIAVELALRGVGVKPDQEVLLAGYDFPGNFRAIESIGARPVLIDLQENDWRMDLSQIEQAIGESTRAILVSHLHGRLVDMTELGRLAENHQLSIVEDACQAPGGVQNRQAIGGIGHVGVLSFGGSKLLSAGRGGAILSNDESIVQRAKIFSQRGNEAFPFSQLQSAALLPQLEVLGDVAAKRHSGHVLLHQLLRESKANRLVPWKLSSDPSQELYATYKFPLVVGADQRAALIECLQAEGIAVGEGFRGFANRSARRCRKPMALPNSKLAASQTVLLHHPVLLEDEAYLRKLAARVNDVYRYVQLQEQ